MTRRKLKLSKKDFDEYYNVLTEQYEDFKNELRDFNELCSKNIVAPEVVESAKKTFQVVEDNWKRLNYVMYLLNKPVKKSKQRVYSRQNSKLLAQSVTKEQVVQENIKSKENFQELVKN